MSMSEATQNGLTVGFIIMIFTDLIGNTLVILTVFKTPAMRTPMNYLLVNLAVADITVAMFIAPRYIVSRLYTHPTGQAGTYVCKLLTGEVFTWVGALCSVYTLVAISIERYYAIMKPHSSKGRFTMNKFKLTAAACWIFATLWNLPLFMFSYFDEKNKFCNFAWPFKDFTKYHSVINVFIFGGIPITTMVILYSRVTYRLWFKTNDQPAGTQQGTIRARKHVTKMVLTVSIIFIISWLPNIIVYPLSSYSNTPLYGGIHIMSIVFVTFNSSVNPIIYSLQSTMFRKNIWRVITCGKHAVHNSETSGGNSTRNTNASTTGTWAMRVKPRQTDDLSLVDCD